MSNCSCRPTNCVTSFATGLNDRSNFMPVARALIDSASKRHLVGRALSSCGGSTRGRVLENLQMVLPTYPPYLALTSSKTDNIPEALIGMAGCHLLEMPQIGNLCRPVHTADQQVYDA
jgi:hypothetical protein